MLSILIPTYKDYHYIEEQLDSIYNLKGLNNIDYEVIIGIDGCVKTKDYLLKIRSKYKNLIIYYFNDNKGWAVTLNSLINFTKYKYILKVDGDDILHSDLLEKTYHYLKEYDIIRFKFNKLVNNNLIGNETYANGYFLIKKSVYNVLGGYIDWYCSSDSEFIHRFKLTKLKEKLVNYRLFDYRIHKHSLTSTVPSKIRVENKIKIINTTNICIEPIINNNYIKL